MFDAWVKVFLIFMGGPLFMMFGGLAVLLWGTWPTKARNGSSLKYRTVECGNSCSEHNTEDTNEGNVAKPRPSISINQLACFKKNTHILYNYMHTHIYICLNHPKIIVWICIVLWYIVVL
jgi:hypothetical protein